MVDVVLVRCASAAEGRPVGQIRQRQWLAGSVMGGVYRGWKDQLQASGRSLPEDRSEQGKHPAQKQITDAEPHFELSQP